jgi:uncharacterized protein YndB with AHSA1/START domain
VTEQRGGAETEQVAPVRRSVTVGVDRARAFDVFTTGFDTWWNRSHHIGAADLDEVIIEPREGGRWYERGVDGSECDWGRVLSWDPPARIVLAWQISARWQFDADVHTEVEVTFTEEGPDRTRVELEHRKLEAMGAMAAETRARLDDESGWAGLLALFAERVRAG